MPFEARRGIEKIFSTLERDLESFERTSGDPQTVGILLDSDKKTAQERLRELKQQLSSLKLDIPDDLGSVSDGVPRVGVFAVPAPGVEGTLEDLLLMIGEVSYPELSQSARAYADGWSEKAKAGLPGSEWKPIKKPAGAKKAAVAAMAAILKPGKSTQVSLEDNRWVTEETKAANQPERWTVFLPGSPNPALGRMVLVEPSRCIPTNIPIDVAIKALLSTGKTGL